MDEELERLFRENRVVRLEEIESYMGESSEDFWYGTEDTMGMFDWLEMMGFEMVECKTEKGLSEVYVNFDRFKPDFPQPKPSISVTKPASKLENIQLIKESALNLAVKLEKDRVQISTYYDGFSVRFNHPLEMNHAKFRHLVLEKLGEELNLEFPTEER